MTEPDDLEQHELGILFVHGIGQSREGDTLLGFGEPLRQALEALAPKGGKLVAKVLDADLLPGERPHPAHARLQVESTAAPASPGAAPGAVHRSEWLMAEAWWADKFPLPSFADLSSWTFKVLPWTVIAHFDRRFRRLGFRFHGIWTPHRVHAIRLPALLAWLREGLLLTLAMALSPLLVAALALIGVLALVPVTAVREAAAWVQRLLAATLGDSFVFAHHPLANAAIVTSVRERLEWLSARCRKVLVVAHSQGAAVAHQVLRESHTAHCDVFISFGSGLAKLAEMERIRDSDTGRSLLGWATAGTVAAVAGLLAPLIAGLWVGPLRFGLHVLTDAALVVASVALVGVGLMTTPTKTPAAVAGDKAVSKPAGKAVGFAALLYLLFIGLGATAAAIELQRGGSAGGAFVNPLGTLVLVFGLLFAAIHIHRWYRVSDRELDPLMQARLDRRYFLRRFALPHRTRLRWYDFHASADPVSNGALLDVYEPRLEDGYVVSTQVHNLRSLLLDHTRYWQCSDDFVRRVASAALDLAGTPFRRQNFWRGARRRRWRNGWLFTVRWLLALPAVAFALMAPVGLPVWLAPFTHAYTPLPLDVFGQLSSSITWTDRLCADAAPWLDAALGWLVSYAPARLAWARWDGAEQKAAFRGDWFPRFGGGFFGFIGLAVLGLAASAARSFGAGGVIAAMAGVAGLSIAVRSRRSLDVAAASGDPVLINEQEATRLRSFLDEALAAGDVQALERLGGALRFVDDVQAQRALDAAAALGSMDATSLLARLWEGREYAAAPGSPERKAARSAAIAALERGAALGDGVQARRLAERLQWRNDGAAVTEAELARALAFYRRALRLHDVAAAYPLGVMLEATQPRRAAAVFAIGAGLGNALCARAFGDRCANDWRAAPGTQLGGPGRSALAEQALQHYDRALALGNIDAALAAATLLDELNRLDDARARLLQAVQLRSFAAALALGELQELREQDLPSAQSRYRQAMRLATHASQTARAQAALGRIAEKQQHTDAAQRLYQQALASPQAPDSVAYAAVAWAALLEAQGMPYDEVLKPLKRGASMDARLGAAPLARRLMQHPGRAARDIADLAPEVRARVADAVRDGGDAALADHLLERLKDMALAAPATSQAGPRRSMDTV